jgi:hypothetical protein
MTDHDPFCALSTGGLEPYYRCSCPLIRRIRDDERAKPCMDARRLRDLRTKVETLPPAWSGLAGGAVWREDVLALIDGSGDG